jgi:hypothetical protein
MRYRPLSELSRRPTKAPRNLLGYLGLAIASNCAKPTAPARRLSMKEAVQLAMQQNHNALSRVWS